jgi:hypothetical protein
MANTRSALMEFRWHKKEESRNPTERKLYIFYQCSLISQSKVAVHDERFMKVVKNILLQIMPVISLQKYNVNLFAVAQVSAETKRVIMLKTVYYKCCVLHASFRLRRPDG